MKVITPETLKQINKESKKHNFGRTLTDEFLFQLDPKGFNCLIVQLRGEDMAFIGIDPTPVLHHQCHLYAKLVGSNTAVEAFIDIAAATYESLTTIDSIEWKTGVSA